jgi:hypothetical protein
MINKVKDSTTATSGVEPSYKRLVSKDGVSVTYDFKKQELIYCIPSGYTIGELTDWRAKYNKLVLTALGKNKIQPTERVLRELTSPVVIHKKKASVIQEGWL